jgi:hypothetical protein
MTQNQQDQLLPLLLAVAMDGRNDIDALQRAVKKFLATLPAEDIAKAASTSVEFETSPKAAEASFGPPDGNKVTETNPTLLSSGDLLDSPD